MSTGIKLQPTRPLAKGPARGAEDPEQQCRDALAVAGVTPSAISRKLGIAKSQAQRMVRGDNARIQGRVFASSQRARTALEAVCSSGPALPADAGVRRLMGDLGELARAVDVGLADGTLDDEERQAVRRELLDVIERAHAMYRGLE